ncbi:MAG TPA: redoxin domain-containing protein [Candidatus Binataceae bacterium]|nr:redoxin domain-containing protein [Candidatus Binataceae bacterium]
MANSLPGFSLSDQHRRVHMFPVKHPALLCFVKEDCPTCNLTMPLLEAVWRSFGEAIDVAAIGQDVQGNAALIERHGLTLPMLDDSALRVSYAYNIEIVPTVVLADATGAELLRFEGFDKFDWQNLCARLARMAGGGAPRIDWGAYPAARPGCGSKSVEPAIAERLAAEASGSPLRARQIELGAAEDPFEFMFERGLSDGLPVIPPTPERVMRMLAGTRRDPQEVIATVPPNMAPLTIEKVAANAVMAGCRPEYLPVVTAVLEAVCTDEFNIHGVMATTAGATPIIVVNGPIRHRLGMNMKIGVLGSGNRANATIGRAVKLALRNVGGARPGEIERTALGGPAKYTACFPEWEERSPWEPLHVERGFQREDDVVTVFGLEPGPRLIVDQLSRTGRALAGSLGMALEACWHPKLHNYGEVLLVISPEHADTFARDGWTKARVRERIQDASARPIRELLPDDEAGEGMALRQLGLSNPSAAQLAQRIPKFRKPENINIVVAGGEAGKFSSVFGGWFSGPMGSLSVSRKIEEVA